EPVAEPIPAPQPAAPQPVTPASSPWLTVAPDEGPAPEWPVAPAWGAPAARGDMPATLAGRTLLPRDNASDLWAASAREVLSGGPAAPQPVAAASPTPPPCAARPPPSRGGGATVTPQPCVSCGLSLSANARFCRRCGTRQG